MFLRLLIGALIWLGLSAGAFAQGAGNFRAVVLSGGCPLSAKYYLNFATGQYCGLTFSSLTVTRTLTTATATNLLPTSPSGFAYLSFAANVAPITPGLGILVEEGRTNFLLHSAVPATQTTGSLAPGTYTLWDNGPGSAGFSSGSATGCGTGVATQGSPATAVITIAGTCVVTVTGSLNAFQLELNLAAVSNPTSFIVTTTSTGFRGGLTVVATVSGLNNGASILGVGAPNSPVAFTGTQTLLSLNDGTNANKETFRRVATSGNPSFGLTVASSALISANIGGASAWAQSTTGKISANFQPSSQRAAYNGVLDTNSYATAIPSGLTKLNIGSDATTASLFDGYVSVAAASPTSLLGK